MCAAGLNFQQRNTHRILLSIFFISLSFRILNVALYTFLGFAPYDPAQSGAFLQSANNIAADRSFDPISTFDRFGIFLSVFYILPGPNEVYARVGMSFLGSVAAVNVFLIGKQLHSVRCGIIAALPIMFFPSYVLLQSTIQRESMILFCLTSATVIYIHKDLKKNPYWIIPLVITLFITGFLRFPNFLVVFAMLSTFVLFDRVRSNIPVAAIMATISLLLLNYITKILPATPNNLSISQIVNYFELLQIRRARGRTVYLEGVVPESITDLITFAWVGAVYFLFTPFIWQVETIADMMIFIESTISLVFLFFSFFGLQYLIKKNMKITLILLVTIISASVLYGLGTANFGTAMRHRQQVMWVIFVLGSIGFTSIIKFDIARSKST